MLSAEQLFGADGAVTRGKRAQRDPRGLLAGRNPLQERDEHVDDRQAHAVALKGFR